MVGNPEYNNLAKVTAEGRNAEEVSILEKRFAEESFEYWENIFKENEVPYQKLNTLEDVLEDEEAYANDILRKISYDSFGEQALVTSPLRMKSVGDPVLKRSRPVGYETRTVMKDFGYTDAEIDEVKRILKEEMENVVHYSVPLTTEVGTGKTWLAAH